MGTCFKGWRRKLGVITLLVALASMAGWLRSGLVRDDFDIPFTADPEGETWWGFSSANQSMTLYRFDTRDAAYSNSAAGSIQQVGFTLDSNQADESPQEPVAAMPPMGIDFTFEVEPIPIVTLPIWSIAIPLTLVAAYLLLAKPRAHCRKTAG
jgi:hypothetical protein